MPQSPAPIGNLVESALGRRARVLEVHEPTPDFLEVKLRAEPPPGGWHPGHEIQFRVAPTLGRRYTIRTVSSPETISLLVATTAAGPGTSWIRNLYTDSRITVIAGRYRPLHLNGTHRLYLGDSCSLGALDAYAHSEGAPIVVVEVLEASLGYCEKRWPHYDFIPTTGVPGRALQSWLKEAANTSVSKEIDGALLLGHAQSIQYQRQLLTCNWNLSRRAITTKPFWATGKEGL